MTRPGTHTVRHHLQRVTHDVHQALHCAPVLLPLTTPGLSAKDYTAALAVFAAFYQAVERGRVLCGAFDRFAVQRECDALAIDLGDHVVPSHRLSISNDLECLGVLYVAHGASFGRNTFRANVVKSLVGQSHRFVQLASNSGQWHDLIETLDATGRSDKSRRHIENGATRAFAFIQTIAQPQHRLLPRSDAPTVDRSWALASGTE